MLLPQLAIPGIQKVIRSSLKPVFEDARKDGIDLSNPPADFQDWLQNPPGRIGDQLGAVKPNTYNSRATCLSRMYERLKELGAVRHNPLDGLLVAVPGEPELIHVQAITRQFIRRRNPNREWIALQARQPARLRLLVRPHLDQQPGVVIQSPTRSDARVEGVSYLAFWRQLSSEK
ncbi:hypothetical protein [Deinococcus navajonensis]|uniref:Uncharacterized protein n=1 Tax=Deinococcus navajonensis TaxID=309884 RepID=A0ABV8XH62_9DEIO